MVCSSSRLIFFFNPSNTFHLENTSKKTKPFLSKSNTNRSQHNFNDVPTTPETPVRSKRETNGLRVAEGSNSELERKVDDLTAKIAELTALIMAQHGGADEEL